MARVFALARHILAVVVVTGSVTGRMTIVMGVVRLLLFYRLLLIGRILRTIGPSVLRRAVRVTVQRARGAAVALRSASRRRLSIKRLIVLVAIFLALRASFVAGSLRCSVQRVTTIVVAIVVDVSSTISVAIGVVASPIVAMCDLALGAIGAAIVGGVAHLATEVFRRFAKEAFHQTLDLLMVERTVELFLLVKSLKKLRDRFDGRVLKRFTAENELLAVAVVVRHVVPLQSERVRQLRDVAYREDLGDAKHLLILLRVQARGGHEILH